jgi:hypothetical protein
MLTKIDLSVEERAQVFTKNQDDGEFKFFCNILTESKDQINLYC